MEATLKAVSFQAPADEFAFLLFLFVCFFCLSSNAQQIKER